MNKRGIVLYLHAHQPYRIRKYSTFDTTYNHDYFDSSDDLSGFNNERILRKIAEKSYRPMNALLEKLLNKYPDFRLSLSITGVFIEQLEQWAPDVLEGFKRLVSTGRVEIIAETYYHSLAFFYSREEFERQVETHRQKIRDIFGVEMKVFRNTELSYNDDLAKWADNHGYKGILAEGWDPILEWRSPNYVYKPVDTNNIRLLMKNYRLSDDVAFRFSDRGWSSWPLNADTYNNWVNDSVENKSIVNLFMDYETFGEHQWEDTGIFEFYESFVNKWLDNPLNTFYTASEAIDAFEPVGEISMKNTVTWADTERDLTAWTGNSMQREALHYIYDLEKAVMSHGDIKLISDWRKLQSSDHFYYMCTKWFKDGDVHAYFSPYSSPYDAFLYYMNAMHDIRWRLRGYDNGGLK